MIQKKNKIFPLLRRIPCFYWVTSMLQTSASDAENPHCFHCCQLYGFACSYSQHPWQVSCSSPLCFSQIKVKYPTTNETQLSNISSVSRGNKRKTLPGWEKMNSALVCVFLLPSHKLNKAVKIHSTCDNPFSSFLLSTFSPFCPVLNS